MLSLITGVPPGLESLNSLDEVIVKEQLKVMEVIGLWENSNTYEVCNKLGQKYYTAQEQSNCLLRQCCAADRCFTIHLLDPSGNEVCRFERPCRPCANSCVNWEACCPLTQFVVNAYGSNGEYFGQGRQEWSLLKPHFSLRNANSDKLYEVWGPVCTCTCLKSKVEFEILDAQSGQKKGCISKHWSGLATEFFTDCDIFGIQLGNMDAKMKAVALGLLFLVVSALATTPCTSDEDCRSGCCLKSATGMECSALSVMGAACDVDGKADDVCPCAEGLTCQKIDLSDFGPTAAAVNPIFEKYHYGMCEMDMGPIG